MLVMVCDKSL